MTKKVVQTLLELQQVWCHDRFPEESVPVTNHPLSEEPVPNVQSELPLTQLHSISLCPITGHQREGISICPSAASLKGSVDFHKVTPQPSLLQAEQTKGPQPLLVSLALETFHHLGSPPLDTL